MNDTDTITGKGSWAKHPILSKDGLWDRITRRNLDETSAAVVREWLTDRSTWPTDTTQGLTAKDAAEALHALAAYFESGTPHLHENGRLACTCPNPGRGNR